MHELSHTVYKHTFLFSRLHTAVVLIGIAAFALAISNVVPLLTVMISIIYSFIIPAWGLGKLFVMRLPQLRSFAAAVIALAALVPFWLIVLSALWVFDNQLIDWQVAGLLAVTIVSVTITLLWRLPFTVAIGIHSISYRWLPGFGFFATGLILGLIIALITQTL